MRLRLSAVALAQLCVIGPIFGSTYNYTGALSDPNQAFQIVFTITATSNVTIKTTSWLTGNFDTVLWLDDANKNQIQKNDDSCNGQGCSPVDRDSLISVTGLAPGTYTVYLTTYDQHYWKAGAAGNPPGVLVSGWSYLGDFSGLPPNYALTLTISTTTATPFTQTLFPPSMKGPDAPVLQTPANLATSVATSPNFTWLPVSGTNGYLVYWGTSNPPTVSTPTTATSLTPATPLAGGATYFWKVASVDAANNNTPNPSFVWSFTTTSAAPPAPTLAAPANASSGVSLSPALTWNSVAGSNGYSVYLGTTNPPTVSTLIPSGSSFTPATALTAGTTYYWKVASRDPNNSNAEAPSTVWSFVTTAAVPPVLASPANGATAVPVLPALSWNPVATTNGYSVYLGTTNPPTNSTLVPTGTTFTPATALTASTTYYWKVASRDPVTLVESPSAIWSFTTAAAPPPAPVLVSPANLATGVGTTPTLSWNSVSGTNGYSVYLGTTNPPASSTLVASGTTFTPAAALTAGTVYYWKVASRDPNNNNAEAASAIWSFTTAAAPPPAPVLVSPANLATGVSTTPTLSWNSVSGTNGYSVYLGTTNPPASSTLVASGTTFTPAAALTAGAVYYWKVASRDPNNNNAEAASAIWSFTTAAAPPPAPVLVSPANLATGVSTTPTLSWNSVAGTNGYSVYLGTTNPPASSTLVASGTTFTPAAALTAGTVYYWKVASRDPNNNNAEAASAIWSFTTAAAPPPAPVLVSPANLATGVSTTPTLSWNSVAGTNGYSVYLGTTNPPASSTLVASGTTFTPAAALTAGTVYYWKVASRDPNNNNAEAASAIWSFTTAAAPPPAPVLVSPANLATGVSTTPTLSWNSVAGTNGYSVYLGTTNPPATPTLVASGTTFTPAAALTAGTVYYWKVASRDPNNNNAETASAIWSFTTAAAPPPAPVLVSPVNLATGVSTTPTLSWNSVAGTNGYSVYLGTTNPPASSTLVASGTTYTPATALTAGTKYYWKVASRDPNNNNTETASAIWSFTTVAAPPPAPVLVSPANAATSVSTTPTLTWNSVTGSNGYAVYLGTTNPPATSTLVASGTTYTPATALTAGTKYYWKVASRDPNNNNAEAASAIWSFTTAAPPPPAPVLVSPANAATGISTTPTLTWNSVTGTNGYSVYLGTTNPPATSTLVASGTTYTPATGLTAGTVYYWKVASRDPNNNNAEAASAIWSFTTAASVPGVHHRTITINHAQVPNTDQSSFPLLVNLTDPLLKTTANGGHVVNSSGFDIVFTSDAAATQLLNFDVETYNPATGQLVAWVQVPIVSHVSDTLIYLSYGNSAITTSQQNKAAVWTGYRAVYHMADNAATKTITDATGNHVATNIVNTSTKTTSGAVGSALTFNGSSDYATAANATDLQAANIRTISFWMRPTDLSGAVTQRVLEGYSSSTSNWQIVTETTGNADFNTLRAGINVGGANKEYKIADNSLATGSLYHVAISFNGTVPSAIYLNGTSMALLAPKQGQLGTGSTARLTIAARADNAHPFPGVLDELRIASAVRSADWIRTEYNNQSSPATFYSLSVEF